LGCLPEQRSTSGTEHTKKHRKEHISEHDRADLNLKEEEDSKKRENTPPTPPADAGVEFALTPPGENGLRRKSAHIPSSRFAEWWELWSSVRGTNHRLKAEQAYRRTVTAIMEVDCFQCTASYLESLDNPAKGYNPENFLKEQARDKFQARWPSRKPPAQEKSFSASIKRVIAEQIARGEKPHL
jgi:hypothetical protein